MLSRMDWNPGGLMAIWAEQNTREALFAAMKRREVYATSGTRIQLGFGADEQPLSCDGESVGAIRMGASTSAGQLYFRTNVGMDRTPIAKIELIHGTLEDGNFVETVTTLFEGEANSQCVTFQSSLVSEPAYWYVRVSEAESLRWSGHRC